MDSRRLQTRRARQREGTVRGNPVDLTSPPPPHDEASFAYARGNRLERVERSDGSALLYEFDLCGQVVSKTRRRGDQDVATGRCAWNARGDLVTFSTPNGKHWHYRYDCLGRRVEKRGPTGDTWRYVWAGCPRARRTLREWLTRSAHLVRPKLSSDLSRIEWLSLCWTDKFGGTAYDCASVIGSMSAAFRVLDEGTVLSNTPQGDVRELALLTSDAVRLAFAVHAEPPRSLTDLTREVLLMASAIAEGAGQSCVLCHLET